MKITTNGNFSIVEYPQNDEAEFDLAEDGALFIFGYKMNFAGKQIGAAQRCQTGLKNYRVVGKYTESILSKEVIHISEKCNIDFNNAVILVKK